MAYQDYRSESEGPEIRDSGGRGRIVADDEMRRCEGKWVQLYNPFSRISHISHTSHSTRITRYTIPCYIISTADHHDDFHVSLDPPLYWPWLAVYTPGDFLRGVSV